VLESQIKKITGTTNIKSKLFLIAQNKIHKFKVHKSDCKANHKCYAYEVTESTECFTSYLKSLYCISIYVVACENFPQAKKRFNDITM